MAEDSQGERPEFTGSFLFLMDIAICFKNCNNWRRQNNPQILLRELENIQLSLAGYYEKDQEEKTFSEIQRLKRELDSIIKGYEATKELSIPESFWLSIHKLEGTLRKVWKKSGLQMALKKEGDLYDF